MMNDGFATDATAESAAAATNKADTDTMSSPDHALSFLLSPEYRTERWVWLQGGNSEMTQDVMVMFLRQPNCPGCILHGLPVANQLAASSSNLFDVYCLATAFEDFRYNTINNTDELLRGRLHGASAQKLGPKTTNIPVMPVAYDHVVDTKRANPAMQQMALQTMKLNAKEQLVNMGMPPEKVQMAVQALNDRCGVEALPEKLAEVFWNVRAQGTPTWVVHRANGQILGVRFGFLDEAGVVEWVNSLIGEAV